MTRSERCIRTGLTFALLASALGAGGCFPPSDSTLYTPAPPIDFAKAYRTAKILFDVTNVAGIPDEQLTQQYQTATDEVLVRSTTFPGDTTPSRYMFLKDHATGTQTVYLSGTNSGTLWGFDFDLQTVYDSDFNAPVHQGFDNAALTVLDDVLPRLEIDYDTTVAGYSLGGAMAPLLAKYLILNGYTISNVTTFGEPKLTNKSGVDAFANLPLLRFMNRYDTVPHLPPDDFTPPENFDQIAPAIILYNGPYYAYVTPNDPPYLATTDGNLWNILWDTSINDHGTLYLSQLASKLDGAIQIPWLIQAPTSNP